MPTSRVWRLSSKPSPKLPGLRLPQKPCVSFPVLPLRALSRLVNYRVRVVSGHYFLWPIYTQGGQPISKTFSYLAVAPFESFEQPCAYTL